MKEPPNAGPDDWFFDETLQRWLRHSGLAHWRRKLAEHRAYAATPEAQADRAAFLERFGLQNWQVTAPPAGPPQRYAESMEQETEVQGDRYYDPLLKMEISHAGRAKWRKRLDDARARRDPAANETLRRELGLPPKTA